MTLVAEQLAPPRPNPVRPVAGLVGAATALTVLAVRSREAAGWTYNPDANERLGPGMTLVVLGSIEQVAALRTETA